MSYGIISPLCNRVTMVVDEAEFDLDRWYSILERERVQVWYTAPTAIRMMMRAGEAAAAGHDFSALRFLASVGEPLNAECVIWGQKVFGLPFHDNWWQSETGGIMIANTAEMDIKPGAMGKPLPGIEAGIVSREGESVRGTPRWCDWRVDARYLLDGDQPLAALKAWMSALLIHPPTAFARLNILASALLNILGLKKLRRAILHHRQQSYSRSR